jgi:uncharacterized protein YbjT (DUF2867 family)
VDYRDVAEVAAIALTTDRLVHGTYELCSGTADRYEIAAELARVLRRPVEAREPSFEQWSAGLALDGPTREAFAAIFRFYAEHGVAGNSLVLRTILGREPRTLRDYVEDFASGVRTEAA